MADFGTPFEPGLGKQRHRAAEGVHRIAHAEIAPAMSAGSGEGDLEAAAAQRAGGDVVGVGAVHHQKGSDLARQRRLLAEMPHAQQVAFALFADIGDQQQAAWQFRQVGRRSSRRAPRPAGRPARRRCRRRPGRETGRPASTAISSLLRGASTVSRCAVRAT